VNNWGVIQSHGFYVHSSSPTTVKKYMYLPLKEWTAQAIWHSRRNYCGYLWLRNQDNAARQLGMICNEWHGAEIKALLQAAEISSRGSHLRFSLLINFISLASDRYKHAYNKQKRWTNETLHVRLWAANIAIIEVKKLLSHTHTRIFAGLYQNSMKLRF
jgi:hypothetical protein